MIRPHIHTHLRIIMPHDTGKHTGLSRTLIKHLPCIARVFKTLPNNLQKLPLLRVQKLLQKIKIILPLTTLMCRVVRYRYTTKMTVAPPRVKLGLVSFGM